MNEDEDVFDEFEIAQYEERLSKFPRTCVINAPFVNMYLEPFPHTEVVSQARFSEDVRIISDCMEWYRVETLVDGYRGWALMDDSFEPKELSPFHAPTGVVLQVNRLSAHIYEEPDTIYGPLMTLPFESQLIAAKEIKEGARWIKVFLPDGTLGYIQSGDVTSQEKILNFDEVCQFSFTFLGIPYTWGGRTSFGYDCSGFVQMLYRQMGCNIDRDSKYQFQSPDFHDVPVDKLLPGDLIFFGASEKMIKHVGMSLGEGKFIHTCAVTENMPYVRISSIHDPAWNGSGYYTYVCGKSMRAR